MVMAEIRQQLHQYIDTADDKNVEAIYTVLQGSMQNQQRFSTEELKNFYDIRAKYLEGKTETYTVEEAHKLIRASRKGK